MRISGQLSPIQITIERKKSWRMWNVPTAVE